MHMILSINSCNFKYFIESSYLELTVNLHVEDFQTLVQAEG